MLLLQSSLKNWKSAGILIILIFFSSLAREAINVLREEQKVAPLNELHSKFCCFVKTANFVQAAAAEKTAAPAEKKGGKGKQPKE